MSDINQLLTQTMLETLKNDANLSKINDEIQNLVSKKIEDKVDEYINDVYKKDFDTIIVLNDGVEITLEREVHEKFTETLFLSNNDQHVLLLGPSGSGKTFMAEQVAEALDLDFYYTGAVTDEFKLLGFKNALGEYVETSFYQAITRGGLFLFDEVDASVPEAMLAINMALANKKMDFPNGTYNVHPDFKVIATANTLDGADATYTGRTKLDGATINRFAVVEVDYDSKLELQILDQLPVEEESVKVIYEWVVAKRRVLDESGSTDIITTRDLINLVKVFRKEDTNNELFCKLKNIFKIDPEYMLDLILSLDNL